MNTIIISGKIKKIYMVSSAEQTARAVGILGTRHKTRAGELKYESFRFSAWGNTALRMMENIQNEQIVAIKGYLTQGRADNGITYTEICVEEFIPAYFNHSCMASNGTVSGRSVTPASGPESTDDSNSIITMVARELQASINAMTTQTDPCVKNEAIHSDDIPVPDQSRVPYADTKAKPETGSETELEPDSEKEDGRDNTADLVKLGDKTDHGC